MKQPRAGDRVKVYGFAHSNITYYYLRGYGGVVEDPGSGDGEEVSVRLNTTEGYAYSGCLVTMHSNQLRKVKQVVPEYITVYGYQNSEGKWLINTYKTAMDTHRFDIPSKRLIKL